MPEIAEVECARCLLERMCCSKRIVKVEVVQDTKVFDGSLDGSLPDDFHRRLKGAKVEKASRKGKQLWLQLDSRPWVLFHLGMTGSFAAFHPDGHVESAEYVNTKVDLSSWPPKHWKLHFEMEGGGKVAFIAVRRFERIRLVQDPESEPPVSELGFDPLYGLPPLEDFSKGLKARQGSVKGALLDQKFSAGVGNWVADEVLYQARVHPEVSPVSMSPEQVKSVYEALAYVVSTACKLSADSSKFPDNWLFHHRWGKKEGKVQGNAVKFITVASRTTAWVPAVQKKTTAGTSGTEEGDGKGARAPQVKGRGKKPAAKKVLGSKATKGLSLRPEDESVAVKKKRANNEVDTPSAVQVRRTRQKPSPNR